MSKVFEINGCIEVPQEVTEDEVLDAIISLVEAKGWFFGGGVSEVQDE